MVGFPHSEILGSKLIRSSPGLIAAYYVLHRLHAPRHPLDALKALDRSHYRCPQLIAAPLETLPLSSGKNEIHVFRRGIDRSDQKYQNSRALLSLRGVPFKQAAKHLFTMSKDPANAHPCWMASAKLALCARRYVFRWVSVFTVNHQSFGGARRDRTDDILLAKQALSQLSYGPIKGTASGNWWARVDSNYRPHAYQACALTT